MEWKRGFGIYKNAVFMIAAMTVGACGADDQLHLGTTSSHLIHAAATCAYDVVEKSQVTRDCVRVGRTQTVTGIHSMALGGDINSPSGPDTAAISWQCGPGDTRDGILTDIIDLANGLRVVPPLGITPSIGLYQASNKNALVYMTAQKKFMLGGTTRDYNCPSLTTCRTYSMMVNALSSAADPLIVLDSADTHRTDGFFELNGRMAIAFVPTPRSPIELRGYHPNGSLMFSHIIYTPEADEDVDTIRGVYDAATGRGYIVFASTYGLKMVVVNGSGVWQGTHTLKSTGRPGSKQSIRLGGTASWPSIGRVIYVLYKNESLTPKKTYIGRWDSLGQEIGSPVVIDGADGDAEALFDVSVPDEFVHVLVKGEPWRTSGTFISRYDLTLQPLETEKPLYTGIESIGLVAVPGTGRVVVARGDYDQRHVFWETLECE